MIKILHIAVSLAGEGIANYLYNYLSIIDLSKYDIDIVINDANVNNFYQEPLEKRGISVFKVCSYEKSTKMWLNEIDNIMKKKKYDIVEAHIGIRSNFVCKMAERNGIQTRIIHTHIAYEPEKIIKKSIRVLLNNIFSKYVTNYIGCSEDALKWTFGSLINKKKCIVIRNAVDVAGFGFDEEKRNEYRKKLGLEDKFVIGCVGRLDYQKNQEFLVDVFDEIAKVVPQSKLVLIGDGPNKKMLMEKCDKKNISEKVLFLGIRNDVNNILNAFDSFVLPSRYEGFGIVFLEAQINMLPSFGTKERVPKSVKISDSMYFISEKSSEKYWAKEIISYGRKDRKDNNIQIELFDRNNNIDCLEEFYNKCIINSER